MSFISPASNWPKISRNSCSLWTLFEAIRMEFAGMQEGKYTLKLITTSEHAGHRLDETVAEWLTEKLNRHDSKAKVRKLLMAARKDVNGRTVRATWPRS